MENLDLIFVVFAILIIVTVAALGVCARALGGTAKPFAGWLRLAERYATERRPSEIQHTGQQILFGGQKGQLKPINEFVTFDATIDDFGLWLICKGADPEQFAPALKVPGTHIRASGKNGRRHVFDLYAEPVVRIAVGGALGDQLAERCTS